MSQEKNVYFVLKGEWGWQDCDHGTSCDDALFSKWAWGPRRNRSKYTIRLIITGLF